MKRKRIDAAITDRDKDILRFLSSGPALLSELLTALKRMKWQVTKAALLIRLSVLRKCDYIISKYYYNRTGLGRYSLYALTKRSLDVLVSAGYMREHVRLGLPDKIEVSHEIAVTSIVRAIKKEASKTGYGFSIMDEKTLKQRFRKSKGRKFPDLLVRLIFNIAGAEKEKDIYVEYDNSTTYAVEVLEKVVEHKNVTLILCPTSERLNTLKRVFGKSDDWVNANVIFGLLSDFYETGFLGTNFTTPQGDKATII